MSIVDAILGGVYGYGSYEEIFGRCAFCGASSRAVVRSDGSWGPMHRPHCQTLRKIEETFPVPNPAPVPLEAVPGPNGCPAAHLLASEREAFGKASKDQVDALWRITEIVQEHMTNGDVEHCVEDLVLYRRVVAICAWALGNTRQLKDPDDVAVLAPSTGAASPSPGKPS